MRMKYLAMNYRNGRTQFAPTITSIKTIKSFAQAFSKACRSRATPLSFSAESEILLGEAQHLFFLKIGGFYPPIQSVEKVQQKLGFFYVNMV
ncbi:hypothetical protein [Pseudoruminococcus massiliensis]|uniref:hypothetical protein n=1 Tax=Pseudoruminococcus massiliensis TaxID=2086583 RepID=UPI003AB4FD27